MTLSDVITCLRAVNAIISSQTTDRLGTVIYAVVCQCTVRVFVPRPGSTLRHTPSLKLENHIVTSRQGLQSWLTFIQVRSLVTPILSRPAKPIIP